MIESDILAAKAIIAYAKADSLNLDILWFLISDYPVYSVGFCKGFKIDTRTMAAKANHILRLAKKGETQKLSDRLIYLLDVKFIKRGGGVGAGSDD